MATEEAGSGNMTEYIQHHLHHLQLSVGDGAFMTINLDTLFFTVLTALTFAVGLTLRLLAIRYRWEMPKFIFSEDKRR